MWDNPTIFNRAKPIKKNIEERYSYYKNMVWKFSTFYFKGNA